MMRDALAMAIAAVILGMIAATITYVTSHADELDRASTAPVLEPAE